MSTEELTFADFEARVNHISYPGRHATEYYPRHRADVDEDQLALLESVIEGITALAGEEIFIPRQRVAEPAVKLAAELPFRLELPEPQPIDVRATALLGGGVLATLSCVIYWAQTH